MIPSLTARVVLPDRASVQQLHLSLQRASQRVNDAETEIASTKCGKLPSEVSAVKLPTLVRSCVIRQCAAVAPPPRIRIRDESRVLPSSGTGRFCKRRAIRVSCWRRDYVIWAAPHMRWPPLGIRTCRSTCFLVNLPNRTNGPKSNCRVMTSQLIGSKSFALCWSDRSGKHFVTELSTDSKLTNQMQVPRLQSGGGRDADLQPWRRSTYHQMFLTDILIRSDCKVAPIHDH
ncbi:uncharacterized protein M421DRAFT_202491 [Didymella exigua CBS 183.55]|uniref:Uncharacterized protein n=1 Tax=Didymella exigua CBS 183.55 TaxID=1150837 RepID=A0A6A5RYY9_9PLEO|nr:uncharacterized protein M421DRAFT_202491 [Didymella exigua CBS 183.55]KAF1933675.1 hypothetical protein M421DRAFT_202491 [Didymella exigua CBS 183.55]